MDFHNFKREQFEKRALQTFHRQAENNPVYREFIRLLKIHPADVKKPGEIPFLPIELFKTHEIKTGSFSPRIVFESSGTTAATSSRHFVKNATLYENSFIKAFEMFYGNPRDFCFLALLPSYLERGGSSLVYMCQKLIEKSNYRQSGFFLNDYPKLVETLHQNEQENVPTVLIGVSFALLDLAENHPMPLKNTIIMETGGMKGRRAEITRTELHHRLQSAFHLKDIHSEYGMTELLSQAYSKGNGIFHPPPWMKIFFREINDPLTLTKKSGGINIIDLANVDSCAFIATGDLGRLHPSGGFEILGRLDNSDVRGCNLMVT